MDSVEKGGLVRRRSCRVRAYLKSHAEQGRLCEVLQPEGCGICTDLSGERCKIDDADIVAFRAQQRRIGLDPLIDAGDRGIPDCLEYG